MKYLHMSREQAGKFYTIHAEKPFYNDLLDFMSSGPVVVALLEKDNAIDEFRELIGSTDPGEATQGTIRNIYGTNIEKSAIHGSDSDENALVEGRFFFSDFKIS